VRKNPLFRLAICTGMLVAMLAHPTPASACSCLESGLPYAYFDERNAVFIGKVIRIADNYIPYFSTIDYILYKLGSKQLLLGYFFLDYERLYGFDVFFKVIDSWKGVENSYARVNTGRGGGDCGFSFEMEKEYLVYASHAYGTPGNYWVTSICSRSAVMDFATEDLDYLSSRPELPIKFSLPNLWAAKDTITFGLIVLSVGIYFILRRRMRNNERAS